MHPANKVLIIEDSVTFATMLHDSIVTEYGFEVDIASTLADARKLVITNPKQYFIAIVDLHLPDAVHGEAAFFVVDSGIPTLVFTGTNDMSSEHLWKMGIADYVHKDTPNSLPYVVWAVGRFSANREIGVLVVDDMHTVRQHIERALRLQNFNVYLAQNVEEAYQQLRAHNTIRIVIVDHFMEGGNGITFTGELTEHYSYDALEIIGMSDSGLSTPFLKAGAVDFLHKPFCNEELLCRINHSADRLDTYQRLHALSQVKNRFLGMAAHDLRNPIGAIKASAAFLAKETISDQRRFQVAKMISSNCSDMLALLENLLDISAIESGHQELNLVPCQFNELISHRLEVLNFHADDKNIALHTHYDDDIETPIDIIKFSQVIDNLVSNAIKFSPPDSDIWIKTNLSDTHFRLQVIDSGPGLSDSDSANLFQPFCKLSAKSTQGEKQTGLGLSIAKSVVEAHGGTIFFKRTVDGHSRFVVDVVFSPP